MSPRHSTEVARGGRAAMTVLLVLLVAVALFLIVRARPEPGPFDPRSSRGDGARALVLLLEQEGASVDVVRRAPSPGDDVRVLVLDDSLDDEQRRRLLEFVERGGVAVVADPASSLHGASGVDGGAVPVEGASRGAGHGGDSAAAQANVPNRSCSIGALDHVRGVFVRDGLLFPVGPTEPHCLGDGDGHAFAIRRDIGDGVVVGLGDNGFLTNAQIRFADNSGVAVALLAPARGVRVDVVVGSSVSRTPDDLGAGEETLGDLVRPGVWMGLAQLAVAFVVLAVARGVRVGRPVDEPRRSPLEGSDAVRARATMMRRAGHHARAGWLLRDDLHRELCDRYGLGRDSSVDAVDAAATERDGVTRGDVRSLLTRETPDARSLLELRDGIVRLRSRWAGVARRAGLAVGGGRAGEDRR